MGQGFPLLLSLIIVLEASRGVLAKQMVLISELFSLMTLSQ